MANHERHKRILKLLSEAGEASVQELASWLGASPATLRRDIKLLDISHQLVRVHGGAQSLLPGSRPAPLRSGEFERDLQLHVDRKHAIARQAAALCKDGDTVIINGGSTTYMMADFLAQKKLRILTNAFRTAQRLLETGDSEVILPGGTIYPQQNVILSPFEADVVRHYYADKLFTGVHGLSLLGAMEGDPVLVQSERRLMAQARQVVVLADSSKFTQRGGVFLCALECIACVITDSAAPDASVQMLERAGVQVQVVQPEPRSSPPPPLPLLNTSGPMRHH